MALSMDYTQDAPTRAQMDDTRGPLVLEFGTAWCGFCLAAQPLIASAFVRHPEVTHLKIEDGPGRALGRSYRVKLWPTLIFLFDGQEVARLVRPGDARSIDEALTRIGMVASAE